VTDSETLPDTVMRETVRLTTPVPNSTGGNVPRRRMPQKSRHLITGSGRVDATLRSCLVLGRCTNTYGIRARFTLVRLQFDFCS
jgi:hypothetical protein